MMAIFKTTLLMVVLLLAYGTQLTVAQNMQSIDDNDQAHRSDARVKLENPTKATNTKASTTPSPLTSCPSQRELGSNRCICFSSTRLLLCSHFTGSFALTNHYQLERLVIAYSDHTDLSMLTQLITSRQLTFQSLLIQNNRHLQRIDPQLFQLFTDNIIIAWNSNLELIEYSNHTDTALSIQLLSLRQPLLRNLEIQNNANLKRIDPQLIQIITDQLHIAFNYNLESIDWSQLSRQLTFISITNVKYLLDFNTNQTTDTFLDLKELHLHNLHFGLKDGDSRSNLIIDELQFPALRTLFIHNTNLGGTVRFAMAEKTHDCGEYIIEIQANDHLDYFDFGALFPSNTSSNTSGCPRFKMNLSNNKNMNSSLLIDQLPVIIQHAANLPEVYLENVPLYCNCDMCKLFNKSLNYNNHYINFFLIYCDNYKQFLKDLKCDVVCKT